MTAPVPFVDALRAELVAAAARQVEHGRPVRPRAPAVAWLAGASAAIVGAIVAVAITLAGPTPAQADVHVAVAEGRVTITLVELEHDPAEIETAAREAGLDVRVSAVPVGPSLVGRFVNYIVHGPFPQELETLGGNGASFAGFSLPEGWPGTLKLTVGRPTAPHETYRRQSDAFAPGEPLACSGLLGARATRAVASLARSPLVLELEVLQPGLPSRIAPDDLAEHGLVDWVVVQGQALSAGHVVLRLGPPDSAVTSPSPC